MTNGTLATILKWCEMKTSVPVVVPILDMQQRVHAVVEKAWSIFFNHRNKQNFELLETAIECAKEFYELKEVKSAANDGRLDWPTVNTKKKAIKDMEMALEKVRKYFQ